MSNMKCPKCGGKLVYWGATGALLKCSQCGFGWGNEELWQELIITRKALNVAVDALKDATEHLSNQEPLVDVMATNLYIDLSKALEQINEITKAKEQ